MRTLPILAAALTLTACFDDPSAQAAREARMERERQDAIAKDQAEDAPRYRGEEGLAVGGSEAADLAAPAERRPGGDGSCGGMGGAEAFVRCVYAGLNSGRLDLSDPERIKVVWGGTDAALAEYKAYPAEFRASLVRTQLSTLCACDTPGPGAFGLRGVEVEGAAGDAAQAAVRLANGRAVTIQLRRQDGAWSFADVG